MSVFPKRRHFEDAEMTTQENKKEKNALGHDSISFRFSLQKKKI
jgi:hypothetical protein